jgi:hypothetical protein
MKSRHKKRSLYSKVQIKKIPARKLKGMIRKPTQPVSIEDMNQGMQDEVVENYKKSIR